MSDYFDLNIVFAILLFIVIFGAAFFLSFKKEKEDTDDLD